MLDGHHKPAMDRLWDAAGARVAALGLSANQITVLGTLGVVGSCAAYLWWPRPLVFAALLVLFELSDNLDGAVARVTGTASRRGAYLDALTDRYKELAVWAVIAAVHDLWPLALAVLGGALITSYAKSRAAMEADLSNEGWPDLMERMERVVLTIAGLVIEGLWPGHGVMTGTAVVLAVGTHVTALQRARRAWGWLGEADAVDQAESSHHSGARTSSES